MLAPVPRPGRTAALPLHEHEQDLLRLSTAGSVDDGKSTLIGRLLYDSKGVYEDQVAGIRNRRSNPDGTLDFALITDGLRAEREQGITIDVAYRYFATPRRKFIIADTPGHEQYTRNMATGASNANLAIILVDARKGPTAQSRRHAFIASLLGIPHMVVAINKMDLVGFREDVYERIRGEFGDFAARLHVTDLQFIPISALHGDNVTVKSGRTPWYGGHSLLDYLETVHIAADRNLTEMRFPVQYVLRPDAAFRGFAGQVASGEIRPGDSVTALPAGRTTRVKSIVTWDGDLPAAFAGMSVALCLEDEIDISRGDMLVPPSHAPRVARRLDARIIWMSATPLDPGRDYLLKHTTQDVKARVRRIRYRLDMDTLEKHPAAVLGLNDIGAVELETQRPVFVDPYKRNRATGAAILIDPVSNETVAACMITARIPEDAAGAEEEKRRARHGHRPAILTLGAANLPLGAAIEQALHARGALAASIVDARAEIVPELAAALHRAGLIVIAASEGGVALADAVEAPLLDGPEEAAVEKVLALLVERGILHA